MDGLRKIISENQIIHGKMSIGFMAILQNTASAPIRQSAKYSAGIVNVLIWK